MGINSVQPVPFSEKSKAEIAPDGTIKVTMTRHWQVQVDNFTDLDVTGALLASYGGNTVPQIGEVAEDYATLYVKDAEATRSDEAPTVFDILVTYVTIPTTEPTAKFYPKVTVSEIERTEDVLEDKNHKPIINSAGDTIDPLLKKAYFDEEISIEYETFQVDWDGISNLRGMVNSTSVTMTVNGQSRTFPINTLLLARCQYSMVLNGLVYYHVSLKLQYRPTNWTEKVVDRGLNMLADFTDGTIPIVDAHNNPVTLPRNLDGAGSELATGATRYLLNNAGTNLGVDIKDQADLNPLLTGIS